MCEADLCGHQLHVAQKDSVDPSDIINLFRDCARIVGHLVDEIGVIDKLKHSHCQRICVTRGHDEPVFAVLDRIPAAWHVRRDDREWSEAGLRGSRMGARTRKTLRGMA
jgi:hypothetical protein